jgi:predicted Zn-dependent protease
VHPDLPEALALSGLALGHLGQGEEAISALRRAVHFKPELPDAWRALGDHYTALEMREAADEAFAQHLRYSTHDPKLMGAALALAENRIPDAEFQLREHLKRHPTDVLAIRMLAEVAARIGRTHDAENLLSAAWNWRRAFASRARTTPWCLHRQNKWTEALQEVEHLMVDEPANPGLRNLKAAVLNRVGEYAASIELYRAVLRDYPRQPKVWMSLGHALKTANQNAEMHRGLPALHRARAAVRRSMVEPREPQDLPLHAGRRGHHARATRAPRSFQRRPLPFPLLAGQGARGRG